MANAGTINVKFTGDTKGLDKSISSAQSKLTSFGNKMKTVGKNMSKFITLPILGIGAAMIKSASDAEETHSKFATVFAGIGDKAKKMAETLSSSYLMSNQEAEKLLSNTGDLLTGFGFTKDGAADLSFEVQKLAADLASFNNVDISQSSEALTKALLGERESLKSLGIAIRESDVKQKLLEKGQADLTGQALLAAKAQATFELAMEQSGNAIGDVGRTSGSFANQMKLLKARFKDLGDSMGKYILPMATKLVGKLIQIITYFNNLSPKIKKTILIIGGIVAVVGPVLAIIGKLVLVVRTTITVIKGLAVAIKAVGVAINTTIGWIGLIIVAILALIPAFVGIYNSWENVENIFIVGWKNIKSAFATSIRWVLEKFKSFIDFFGGADWLDELVEDTKKWEKSTEEEVDKAEKKYGTLGDNVSAVGDEISKTYTEAGNIVGNFIGISDEAATKTEQQAERINKALLKLQKAKASWGKGNTEMNANVSTKSTSSISFDTSYMPKLEKSLAVPTVDTSALGIYNQTLSDITVNLENQKRVAAALGQPYDDNIAKLNEYTQAYQYLLNQGVNPASSGMIMLQEEITRLSQKSLISFSQLKDAALSIGDAFGQAFQQSREEGDKWSESLKNASKAAIIQLVKVLKVLAIQVAMQAASALGPWGMLAVGVLVPAALSLVESLITNALSFARGGMVTGPTLAMVGDNPSGKEAIIPFERMGEFANMVGGNKQQTVILDAVIRGDDILLTSDRSKEKRELLF